MAFVAKPIVFTTDPKGCITPSSHKLNKDGYFRINRKKVWVMYHRLVWEQQNGPIPEGCEINHKCKNRACSNLEHLELLEGSEHAIETNENRYKDRHESAHLYWCEHDCTGTFLASVFGVTVSCACKWIRDWKV